MARGIVLMLIFNKINFSISPLTLRILAINIISLLVLLLGFLYSGRYEKGLIKSELKFMVSEGRLFTGAISEGGVRESFDGPVLAADLSRQMVRKLAATNNDRIILFGKMGKIIVDSHKMLGVGGVVEVEELLPPWQSLPIDEKISFLLKKILKKLPTRMKLKPYPNVISSKIETYPYMFETLQGAVNANVWQDDKKNIFLTASLPVQNLKNVMGAILIMRSGHSIENAVYDMQLTILKIFFLALLVSVSLSLYLSETICRPIVKLAKSVDTLKDGAWKCEAIPDLSYRNDEIGKLSLTLRDMTKSLAERIEFIENFTADIAHELKNPLASISGAVETISIVNDKNKQKKLLKIISEDVKRMDILITDILLASKLDAEMENLQRKKVNVEKILKEIVKIYDDYRHNSKNKNKILLRIDKKYHNYIVNAHELRLAQVIQNIISNAVSFSKPDDDIVINLFIEKIYVGISIENYGPPIPEDKLETIFNRFYTERPKQSDFGLNSGLGLSISKQIIDAHSGRIYAENIKDKNKKYLGVKFTILLPKFS